jgi:uncharacterized protein (DUF433 family)
MPFNAAPAALVDQHQLPRIPKYNADMDPMERITVDPRLMLGQPVITGTRLPVYVIVQAIAAGDSHQELLAAYPFLTEPDIDAALSYAARLAEWGLEVAS